ncbi:LLM class flavin-dependent oxidoreductase [Streptomyces sp. CJ_13]|uniref:LLM class flavin-dependent oxidoreductase n=1 Tax=Streptomyces sp. CJ_13 TaxID=2724943 RepID=UPI001BDD99E8|nr:LLM class flavin-dependent oxidoreductase [Streptomyces sp. CJ_13]MBT1188114.1 LLM class flavin-dependent oxidoreductase [Streptomyces sp. CJ_13]
MRFDIFCSLTQAQPGGILPPHAVVLRNFLEQARVADGLGFDAVWVAGSHFSSELQRSHRRPVIPHWRGEVGLNTDFCQLAGQILARTERIEVGSAIMNIVGQGGPLAAAERVAALLGWHGLDPAERRRIRVGFAGGRFDYINRLSGIGPRAEWEREAWPQVRSAVAAEAAEIFVRLLAGEALASDDVPEAELRPEHFGDLDAYRRAWKAKGPVGERIVVPRQWEFEPVRAVPEIARPELLELVLGSQDHALQARLNRFRPVKVFNLSITQPAVIEATHARMERAYHPAGGPWRREYMPRTVFVFLQDEPDRSAGDNRAAARADAEMRLAAYWQALEGTLSPARIAAAADNALIGTAADIAEQITSRFQPEDRLMLWFDFFTHDSQRVCAQMESFMTRVVPRLPQHYGNPGGLSARTPARPAGTPGPVAAARPAP